MHGFAQSPVEKMQSWPGQSSWESHDFDPLPVEAPVFPAPVVALTPPPTPVTTMTSPPHAAASPSPPTSSASERTEERMGEALIRTSYSSIIRPARPRTPNLLSAALVAACWGALVPACQVVTGLTSLETKEGGAGGSITATAGSTSTGPFCGDGHLDPNEACDDGDSTDGDGCSATCARECIGEGTALDPETGDCLVGSIRFATWADAEASCVQAGGHLATPATLGRADAAHTLALAIAQYAPATSRVIDGPLAVWLGASDAADEGTWVWVDGQPFTFEPMSAPWSETQPDDAGGSEDCLSFSLYFGGMNDLSCTATAPFLCQLPAYAARCGDGLVTHDEECDLPDDAGDGCVDCKWACGGTPAWVEMRTRKCFHATAAAPHATAITTCPGGSSLATLEDLFTFSRVAARVAPNRYWLDASHATGAWVWGNGVAVYPTTNMSVWAMNEPNGTMMQDCLQIETGGATGSTGKYGLKDYYCDATHPGPALCVDTF